MKKIKSLFIYIFEDGLIKHTCKTPEQEDLSAVDDGVLQIIKISESGIPYEYYEGEWDIMDSI